MRFHSEANPNDGTSFAMPAKLQYLQRDVHLNRVPSLSEKQIKKIYPFPAEDGSWGCVFQFDEQGRIRLETMSSEQQHTALVLFVGTKQGQHQVIDMLIDRPVTNGTFTVPRGLTAIEVAVMKTQFPVLGEEKVKKQKKKPEKKDDVTDWGIDRPVMHLPQNPARRPRPLRRGIRRHRRKLRLFRASSCATLICRGSPTDAVIQFHACADRAHEHSLHQAPRHCRPCLRGGRVRLRACAAWASCARKQTRASSALRSISSIRASSRTRCSAMRRCRISGMCCSHRWSGRLCSCSASSSVSSRRVRSVSRPQPASTFAFTSAIPNWGYLPIPLVQGLFGEHTTGVLFVHNIGLELMLWSVGVWYLTGEGSWKRALTIPFFAILAALGLNLLNAGAWLPGFVLDSLRFLGQAPCRSRSC